MLKTCIFGASGYTGLELAKLINSHPKFELSGLYVSEHSSDAGKSLNNISGGLQHNQWLDSSLTMTSLAESDIASVVSDLDLVFLCTPHEFSHNVVKSILDSGAKVMDLSGAFRLQEAQLYPAYYGFEHTHRSLLEQAVYGLVEWQQKALCEAQLVAVPGCYPTASLLALLPIIRNGLLDSSVKPVINAVSGVTGAGRKATLNNSFCEVSLQSYGVHRHRHQPEISSFLGEDVLFTPHLGAFKRGILATISVKLESHVSAQDVAAVYDAVYKDSQVVRLVGAWPKLDDVVNSARCHLHWELNPDDCYLVVSSAIDNLLKGAASQALQCANVSSGLPDTLGLEHIL